LGRTEMKPTALGLGGGHLGDPSQSDENAISTIRGAIERGINFVDTSPFYGVSERRFGLALAEGWRERVYLQTKVGSHPRYLRDFSKKATTWSLENSFKELQTDYVDSVLIHGPRYDIEAPLDTCLEVLVDWKTKGRIGHIGIGVRQPEYHRRAIETGEIDIVLSYLDYTLLDQSLASTTIPVALKNDVGIVIASPLGGSMLAGPEPKLQIVDESFVGKGEPLPPAAIGSNLDPIAVKRAIEIWEWCREREFNIRDLAMQFALGAPVSGNGIVLTGPASPQEFDEAYSSAVIDVPGSVWTEFSSEFGVRI
jgi:aryl-alcohol dehydrogenase-like predicted oxidoreductase